MVEPTYTIVVSQLSEEDGGGFMAYAPDLQGCLADGDTPEAALTNAFSAVGEWVDEARRLGREIPEPGSAKDKSSEFFDAVRRERKELYDALKAQTRVIKKQEKLIKDARAEVERVQAATASLMRMEDSADLPALSSSWISTSLTLGNSSPSKRKARLLS